VEAPSGVEPLHRSFADCSLNHLGTAPRAHYSEPSFHISMHGLENAWVEEGRLKEIRQEDNYRLGNTGISFPRVAG
jgi:hypothetical protein